MQITPPRSLELLQLQGELAAAGIVVPALGTSGDPSSEVHTYDADGAIIDLPASAAAVVTAHVPQPDAALLQRLNDAAHALNNAAFRGTQTDRDVLARLIGVKPVTIPLAQDATAADIQPLEPA